MRGLDGVRYAALQHVIRINEKCNLVGQRLSKAQESLLLRIVVLDPGVGMRSLRGNAEPGSRHHIGRRVEAGDVSGPRSP
ncbi:hypothetical protein D3C73_1443210 [compost metagenome]